MPAVRKYPTTSATTGGASKQDASSLATIFRCVLMPLLFLASPFSFKKYITKSVDDVWDVSSSCSLSTTGLPVFRWKECCVVCRATREVVLSKLNAYYYWVP
jgi:hypothetical protein